MSSDVEQPVTARTSERGAATRTALLKAAKEVFVSKGFAEAGVTDVVGRAEASVGSLYHHFSGKADLYLTLFEEFQAKQAQRTSQAAREARAEGESDPMKVFIRAARAYLDGCLEEREVAALFLRGDGPPGFEVVMRDRLRKWAERNAALFDDDEGALVVVITGALAAAVSEVVRTGDRDLAEDVLAIIGQIRPAASATGAASG
ncbi:TetR/AcrR family transcriptional regulator [Nonomuraea rhodomycinica]|uniref:TetR/AcrR family transcriptional regulator n=1 Tax=Nonomuraea rhodomycinica TaxID=1712872 RepID=A0A7Y6IUY4_9ACTN|nr:TetR/AcrR family transcriptional regulator [Nonomuraea rhodomycinica]NUW43569.1 TetR/AcrR family transcriptional regulator [Nonomuraea rhodomycinica]